MLQFQGSPYSLMTQADALAAARIREIEERVSLFRGAGTLTAATLQDYYGRKRFEQVAESNAIEGSTLSVGETELAVLKGITITGHDPAYVKDAIALDAALRRATDLARETSTPTSISQVSEIHQLILGGRAGAGVFRSEPVMIRGARHTPPATWPEIMAAMERWEEWSQRNAGAPAPLRAAVLHAWLTHVHPFIDGNGRVSRAIGNLELVRAGYPSIIIKKTERDRYIDALSESDDGGDIRSFLDLILDRIDGSLTGLESSAKRQQGYSPAVQKIMRAQEQQLKIWSTGVRLLWSILQHNLDRDLVSLNGFSKITPFDGLLDLDDYLQLCSGRSISGGWAFIVSIEVPSVGRLEKLAYIQHRTAAMYNRLGREGGPSLFWSKPNPSGFPKWTRDDAVPFATEVTAKAGSGDEWTAILPDGSFVQLTTTELAARLSEAILMQLVS